MRDKIFISEIADYNDELTYFSGYLVEKNLLKNVVKGSKFKGIINENEFFLFPYELNGRHTVISEEKLINEFPNTYRY